MWNIGGPEILVILVVALVVLGPKRLPEAGRQVGNAIRQFRTMTAGVQQELRDALPIDELRASMPVDELRQLADMRTSITRDITRAMTVSADGTASHGTGVVSSESGALTATMSDTDDAGCGPRTGVDVPAPDGHAAEMDAPMAVTRIVAVPAPSTESTW